MKNELVAFAQRQATIAVRRVAFPAAQALVGAIFLLLAVAGMFAALFFWFEPKYGPLTASLIVTGVAFVIGIIVLLPLAFKRSPKPPPPGPDAMLPNFVSLLARSAPTLAPRQLALTAVLLALALGLMARGPSEGKK